jgi:molecular chaperone DnaJ
MASKDYYRILNIPSSSSTEEIKKAFRKLAQQLHPDKNAGNQQASEKFSEIHEAYLVLSDSKKRAAYNYIRYTENPKRKVQPIVNTPEDLLQISMRLSKEIALCDPYRIDRDLLYFQLLDVLSTENLLLLRTAADITVTRKIVEEIMTASRLLPWNMLAEIIQKLTELTETDQVAERGLQHFISHAKQQYYWNRYKVYIALVIAALACLLILLSDNK